MSTNLSKKRICLSIFIIIFVSFVSVFTQHRLAVDKSLRLAPLANGWVSHWAGIHLSPISLIEKYKKTVNDDLELSGRFRPASQFFVSLSYALSPVVHKRIFDDENSRPYWELVTGDLRIQAILLALSVVISCVLLSILIFRFTGYLLPSLLPLLFVPLSPSLTSNLSQNYIDSQEIPLILWTSLWLLIFASGLAARTRFSKSLHFFGSVPVLILVFMSKEIACALFPALLVAVVIFSIVQFSSRSVGKQLPMQKIYLSANIFFCFICTLYVYVKVGLQKVESGTGFETANLIRIKENIVPVWGYLSTFSLNQPWSLLLFVGVVICLIIKRNETINSIPNTVHLGVLVLLLATGYGFYCIVLPWKYMLFKYLFPSIVFISFAVCYCLGLVPHFLPKKIRKLGVVLLSIPCLFVFYNYLEKSRNWNNYTYESITYGTAIIDELVDSIADGSSQISEKEISVFVEYGTDAEWGKFVPWGKLQLIRLLNIEKGYNLINQNGEFILNLQMPADEMSSFRFYQDRQGVYLTNRREELSEREFDLLYKGYKSGKTVPEQLSYTINMEERIYRKTGIMVAYTNSVQLPEFTLYQYVPLDF